MKIKGLIFLLYLFSSTSNGAWSPEVISHVEGYREHFQNPYLSSIRGTCGKNVYKYKSASGLVQDGSVTLVEYFKKPLGYKIGLKQRLKKTIKAPLVLAIPGAFTNLKDSQSQMWMNMFLKRGYHTLVFPNPWSRDFIDSHSKFSLGDFKREARALYEGFNKVHQELKRKDLVSDEIHIFGLSYGGFMASLINYFAALDGIKIKYSTIISAPRDLGITLDLLDSNIKQIKEMKIKGGMIGGILTYLKLCRLEPEEKLTDRLARKSQYLAIKLGFKNELIKSLIKFDKLQGHHKVPKVFTAQRGQWKKELSFSYYFNNYAPSMLEELDSDSAQLFYWVDKVKALGIDNSRILLSDNDFINYPLREAVIEENLLLSGGGHFGFRKDPWFEKFIDLSF